MSIFGQTAEHRIQLDWQTLYPLGDWGPEDLEVPFSESKVKASIFDMGSDKDPEPDGFSALFFKNFGMFLKVILWICSQNCMLVS